MKVGEIKRSKGREMCMNRALKIADYEISIQASSFHYCTPRTDLNSMGGYVSVEMAIFNKNGFVNNPRRSRVISKFGRFSELEAAYQGGTYNWVAVDLVDDFLTYLEEHYQEKIIQRGQ